MEEVSSPPQKRKKKSKKQEAPSTHTEVEQTGRKWTLSIAIPVSFLDSATSPEMRSYFAGILVLYELCVYETLGNQQMANSSTWTGQLARIAAVFCVDEIVIFDDKDNQKDSVFQLARILQYVECPQYLRKHFFPFHKDLQYVGLLNPLDAPHHLRSDEQCLYREGVVLSCDPKQGTSQVDVGLSWNATIDGVLGPQSRVTVKFHNYEELTGEAVPCTAPRIESGFYWGYDVRVASSFSSIFLQSPHEDGYDLLVGMGPDAPDTISCPLDSTTSFQHACIVFRGAGRDFGQLLAADDKLEVKEAQDFFDLYVNPLPSANRVDGGSPVRTEEAILIGLSALRPNLTAAAMNSR